MAIAAHGRSARLVLPCLVLYGSLAAAAFGRQPKGDAPVTEYLPGLVEVVFADTASDSTALRLIHRIGLSLDRRVDWSGTDVVVTLDPAQPAARPDSLRRRTGVRLGRGSGRTQAWVRYPRDVSLEEARQALTAIPGVAFVKFAFPFIARVRVPAGEERMWIQKLRAQEAVRDANPVQNPAWYDRFPATVMALTVPESVPPDDTLLVTLHVQRPGPCYEPDGIESRWLGEDTLLLVPFQKKRRAIRCTDVSTIHQRVFRLPLRSPQQFVVAVEDEGRRHGIPVSVARAPGKARNHRHVMEIRDSATGAAVEGRTFRVLPWAEVVFPRQRRVVAELTTDSSGRAEWVVPCTPGASYQVPDLHGLRVSVPARCGAASRTLVLAHVAP